MSLDLSWYARAACKDVGPDRFFAVDDKDGGRLLTEARVRWCGSCPVMEACLKQALLMPEKYGIFGGVGSGERKKLRRFLANRGLAPVRERVWRLVAGEVVGKAGLRDKVAAAAVLARLGISLSTIADHMRVAAHRVRVWLVLDELLASRDPIEIEPEVEQDEEEQAVELEELTA